MNFEQVALHLEAYRNTTRLLMQQNTLSALSISNMKTFEGFGLRDEVFPNSLVLTAEGVLGSPQKVMIPKNLFDFDLNLVLNLIAHEMLHVRQKAPGHVIEEKSEREFQAYYEMLFHKVFPQIPEVSDFYKKDFGSKALEYYKRMGEGSELQKKYAEQKLEVEQLINSLS
jgi:hypothetical protein